MSQLAVMAALLILFKMLDALATTIDQSNPYGFSIAKAIAEIVVRIASIGMLLVAVSVGLRGML